MMTVENLDRIVIGLVADEGTNDREFVSHPCQKRKRFADFKTGDVGRDGTPWPCDFARSLGLQVKHVLMRWTADQVNHDH